MQSRHTPNSCRSTNCNRLTSDYLCAACAHTLQEWHDTIDAYVLITLKLIAEGKEKGFTTTGRGHRAKDQTPVNLRALDLIKKLQALEPVADVVAHPQAAAIAREQVALIEEALDLVHGKPVPQQRTMDARKYRPLTPTQLETFFHRHGVKVTSGRIRKWKHRGQLKPAYTIQGTSFYRRQDVAALLTERELNQLH